MFWRRLRFFVLVVMVIFRVLWVLESVLSGKVLIKVMLVVFVRNLWWLIVII